MQSTAKDGITYIQEASPERQPYLTGLRELYLEILTGYEEVMPTACRVTPQTA